MARIIETRLFAAFFYHAQKQDVKGHTLHVLVVAKVCHGSITVECEMHFVSYKLSQCMDNRHQILIVILLILVLWLNTECHLERIWILKKAA